MILKVEFCDCGLKDNLGTFFTFSGWITSHIHFIIIILITMNSQHSFQLLALLSNLLLGYHKLTNYQGTGPNELIICKYDTFMFLNFDQSILDSEYIFNHKNSLFDIIWTIVRYFVTSILKTRQIGVILLNLNRMVRHETIQRLSNS